MDRALRTILDAAFASHQAGRLEEAEGHCLRLLEQAPLTHEALHLLGVLRHLRGQSTEGEGLIAKALSLQPDIAGYYENLAAIQRYRGAFAASIETCRSGLERTSSPRLISMLLEALLGSGEFQQALLVIERLDRNEAPSADRLADRAFCLFRLDRVAEALSAAKRSHVFDPAGPNALSVLADVATHQGDHGRTTTLWCRALWGRPDWPAARVNLGLAYLRLDDASAALATLSSMPVPSDADLATTLFNGRAAAYRKLGRPDAARRCLETALLLVPGSGECLANLSEMWRGGDAARAVLFAGRSIACDPFGASAHNNQGLALEELSRIEEARRSLCRAIAVAPGNAEFFNNLASPLRWLGRFAAAEVAYRRSVAIDPTFIPGWFGLGEVQLTRGDLAHAWGNYDWRMRGDRIIKARPFRQPPWQGPGRSGGKLLVWAEQGLGDEVVFGSMLPDLVKARVPAVVECDARMVSVFERAMPTLEFVARKDPPDPRLEADDLTAQVPMGGLGKWYRARIEDFPTSHYLKPRPDLLDYWRRRLAELDDRPKVGFAWRSRRVDGLAHRVHPPVLEWAPVLAQREATFISLQYGESDDDIAAVRSELGTTVHKFPDIDLMNDLEGVLAMSAALDMAVGSATSAYSLAAATGMPVFLAVPEFNTWWFGTDRYPWLPSVRAYSHHHVLPWSTTINRLAKDFALAVRERQVDTHRSTSRA